MPIYEYTCSQCKTDSEILVRGQESPTCPQCGSEKLDKQWSVPAAPSANNLPIANQTCGRPQCGMGGCGREG